VALVFWTLKCVNANVCDAQSLVCFELFILFALYMQLDSVQLTTRHFFSVYACVCVGGGKCFLVFQLEKSIWKWRWCQCIVCSGLFAFIAFHI